MDHALGPALLALALTGIASMGLLIQALRWERRWRLVVDLPQTPIAGAFVGLIEVHGNIRCGEPLRSYCSDRPCVFYRYTIEEHWTKTVTETVRDAEGHSHTETRTESGWTTIASDGQERPFEIADGTGAIRVDPAGAKVTPLEVLHTTCGPGDPLYYAKGPARDIAHSDHERRFQESVLPIDARCTVIGQAQPLADDPARLHIAAWPQAPMYVISLHDERSVASGFFYAGLCAKIGGGIASVAGAGITAHLAGADNLLVVAYAAGGLSYLGACLIGWLWLVHNALVDLRQRVRQAWANIDVQLSRRFDLIRELLPLVQALTHHEREVQTTVASMRAQLQATPPGAAGPDPTAVAPQLTVLAERYPDLVAQAQFTRLRTALIDCEDRIALARTYFNDIATHWNTRLERFPDVVAARLFHYARQAPLDGWAGIAAAPVVRMDTAQPRVSSSAAS